MLKAIVIIICLSLSVFGLSCSTKNALKRPVEEIYMPTSLPPGKSQVQFGFGNEYWINGSTRTGFGPGFGMSVLSRYWQINNSLEFYCFPLSLKYCFVKNTVVDSSNSYVMNGPNLCLMGGFGVTDILNPFNILEAVFEINLNGFVQLQYKAFVSKLCWFEIQPQVLRVISGDYIENYYASINPTFGFQISKANSLRLKVSFEQHGNPRLHYDANSLSLPLSFQHVTKKLNMVYIDAGVKYSHGRDEYAYQRERRADIFLSIGIVMY